MTLIITGLVTNACVRSTAIDDTKLGFNVVLIEDATEASSEAVKQTATDEIFNVWGKFARFSTLL